MEVRGNYRDRQVSVYLLRELHPLALLPVDVDHEAVHLAAEPAYEPCDHSLVRAAHLCCPRSLPCGLRAPTHTRTHARASVLSSGTRVLEYSGLTDRQTLPSYARSPTAARGRAYIRQGNVSRLFLSSRSPPEFVYRRLRRRHTERAPSDVQVQDRIYLIRHLLERKFLGLDFIVINFTFVTSAAIIIVCRPGTVFSVSPGFAR